MNNNAVPDPVPDNVAARSILEEYRVTLSEVRESFDLLEGSFLKKVSQNTSRTWQFHHPTMIEALHRELSTKSAKMLVYLQAAKVEAILRDTTTIAIPSNSRMIFLPNTVYSQLAIRLAASTSTGLYWSAGKYLAERASDDLLILISTRFPNLIAATLSIPTEPQDSLTSIQIAVRLSKVRSGSLLSSDWLTLTVTTVKESVLENGWILPIADPDFAALVPGLQDDFLRTEITSDFPSFEKLYNWYSVDLSDKGAISAAIDDLAILADTFQTLLSSLAKSTPDLVKRILEAQQYFTDLLFEQLTSKEAEEELQADIRRDGGSGTWRSLQGTLGTDRFGDVDE